MKMKLVYIEGNSPSEDIEKACDDIGMFRYMDMGRFTVPDKKALSVVTNNDDIREAYENVKIPVTGFDELIVKDGNPKDDDKDETDSNKVNVKPVSKKPKKAKRSR